MISARERDDLDIDLLAEPQGLVARHRQGCVCRGPVDEIDEVFCGDGRVWRCWWLTQLRCGVQADDGVEVGECSSLQLNDFHERDPSLFWLLAAITKLALYKATNANGEAPPQLWGVPGEQDVPDVVVALTAQRLTEFGIGVVM